MADRRSSPRCSTATARARGSGSTCPAPRPAPTLLGPALLDYTVNGRPAAPRRHAQLATAASSPAMAPHGIYTARGDDHWVAHRVPRRPRLARARGASSTDAVGDRRARYATLAGRLEHQDELDELIARVDATRDKFELAAPLHAARRPRRRRAARPRSASTTTPAPPSWGSGRRSTTPSMGEVRVDGLPVHLSETDWEIEHAARRCLGEHNDYVFGEVLGLSARRDRRPRATEGSI